MIDCDEYTVRLVDLPAEVGGVIKESKDGFLNIYINARHGWRGQRRSYRHEMRHAENGDLHSDEPVDVIEARADGVDPRLRSIPSLRRARDLMPKPEETVAPVAAPSTAPPSPPAAQLTPHQARVLLRAISDLDAWYYSDMP